MNENQNDCTNLPTPTHIHMIHEYETRGNLWVGSGIENQKAVVFNRISSCLSTLAISILACFNSALSPIYGTLRLPLTQLLPCCSNGSINLRLSRIWSAKVRLILAPNLGKYLAGFDLPSGMIFSKPRRYIGSTRVEVGASSSKREMPHRNLVKILSTATFCESAFTSATDLLAHLPSLRASKKLD